MADLTRDSSKIKSVGLPKHITTSEDILTPLELKDILDRLTEEEHESKEIKFSVVRKLTADMTERGRKLGTHLESIHSYVVKDCSNIEENQDNYLSEELADEIRKRTTSVDSEIKQLENQLGQLQRTLVKGKARRESIRHRLSTSCPTAGRKVSSVSSSCSSVPEDEELTTEDYKSKIELLENEKLELLEDKKDLNDEIKFLKYQLQYRLEVQALQNERDGKPDTHVKLENENKTLRKENAKLKERFSAIKKKLEESGEVDESLLIIADIPDAADGSALIESELDRMYTERKILLSTIMRMQSMEKDEDEEVSYADFGVQCSLVKMESVEDKDVTPLVAKLTEENKVLKKHITDMQNEIDEREEESKTLDEENYKLIEEKRTLEDTINKLRTQINETLDTTLDEIEHLHSFNEDLEKKFKRTEAKYIEMSQTLKDLQNRNCKTLENLLDEVENKPTMEEVFKYLDREVRKLIEENCITVKSSEKIQEKTEEMQFTSNLLNEVKTCKDLLESQRSHIRKLQLEKRDIEEGYTKMRRELLLLKSSKQRARETSKELQFLKKRRVKSLNDGTLGGIETKAAIVDKESLQREVKRLGIVKTQLENNVQKLKKENATLEDEKVCLLGSLYHQLERNEALEIQIEELTVTLEQWEAKADLENEVFEKKSEELTCKEDQVSEEYKSGKVNGEDDHKEQVACEGKESLKLPETLDEDVQVSLHADDTENARPASPVVSVVSSAAEESLQEMKQKIHALGEQLQNVQESVSELETERDKLQEDLEDSKKNEKELRNVIIHLKRENTIHLDKLAKSNELAETLQVRLREAKEAKEEAMESVEEANEEKFVCKRHSELLDKRLQEVTKQRDDFRHRIDVLNKKVASYEKNLKEIHALIDQIVNISFGADEKDTAEKEHIPSEVMEEDETKKEDYYEKECMAGLKTILKKTNEIKKEHEDKCYACDILKNQLDTLNTEKEVLHKSVREIDDRKKQMKGFITKLTDEKEKVTEQLDEMRQQKSNLADALENVYRSKEKLQNRFGEALCKQEQYKKSLTEALEEVHTLKESLHRVVNEHETMKESLLTANREVERLKSQQQLPYQKTELDVIPEEEAKGLSRQDENRQEEHVEEHLSTEADEMIHTDEEKLNLSKNKENVTNVLDKLKESVALLSTEKSKFEVQMKLLLCCNENIKDKPDKSSEEHDTESEIEKENEVSVKENGVAFTRNETVLEVLDNGSLGLEAIIVQIYSQLENLTTKLGCQKTTDSKRKDFVEDKENEKELETTSKGNMEFVKLLETVKEEKERIQSQLRRVLDSCTKNHLKKETSTESIKKEIQENTEMPSKQQQQKELKNGRDADEICDLINKLEMIVTDLLNTKEFEIAELPRLTEELQEENKSLNDKLAEIPETSKHFADSEMELEKSIKETEALEKQVEVLSNEGATLRGEADERVQRLIELEEKMIVTMEKKLELAEYAKSLKSKKDSLEKKCEQLSREVEGLTLSRDQLLAGKEELIKKLQAEVKMLKEYKVKSIIEIEELNKVIKVGKQDYEAVEVELDSMQRKIRALGQNLEKSALKEAEWQKKASELEQCIPETTHQVRENKELNELLNELIISFDKEITSKESTFPEYCKNMETMKKKVCEIKEWIVNANEALKNQTNETKVFNSFVQDVNEKISEILSDDEIGNQAYSAAKISEKDKVECEIPQNKENCDSVKCKLEILIQKLNETFRSNTGFQTELEKIREDNERISKELTSKSNFLQTMRGSFEQLLQERNLLAQRAAADSVKLGECRETSEADDKLQQVHLESRHSFCSNCKKLEKEYNDLNSKFTSMNKESFELVEKCRRLKEQLILLKQQQEDIEKDEIPNKEAGEESLVSSETEVVQQNADEYQCEPQSLLDTTEGFVNEVSDETFQEGIENVKKQLNDSVEEKAELEAGVARLEDERQIQGLITSREVSQTELKTMENKIKEIMHQHQRETTELKKEMTQLKKEKKEIEALVNGLRSELNRVENDQRKPQDTVEMPMSAEKDNDEKVKLHKTLAERSNSLKDLNEKLGVSKTFMQKILDENTDLKESVVIFETEAKEMVNEIEILKVEVDLKKKSLVQTKEEASIIESKNNKLEEEKEGLKEQLRTRGYLLATLEKDKESFKVSLREAQNEVTSLKKQNSELTDLLNTGKQRRTETENLIKKLKQSCDDMTTKFEKASTEKKTNEELLQNEKVQTMDLKAKLEKLEKDYEGLKTVYEKSKEKVENLTEELRKDKARKNREIGNIKQENAKLLADEGRADRACDSLREQLDNERKKTERLAEDLRELNKENKALKKTLQLESDEKSKSREELKENKKEGRRLSTLTSDLKSKVANLEAIITAVKKENNDIKEEWDRTKEKNRNLRTRLDKANEDKDELEKIIDDLRKKRQKLYDEIEEALNERDDFEDKLIDTKQQMTKEVESLVIEKSKANEKLQLLENVEITLRKELEEHENTKATILDENQNLKNDLEKIKTELERIQTSNVPAKPETVVKLQEKEKDYIRKLKEGQYEIKKLTCALEKSKKEANELKTKLQKLKQIEVENTRAGVVLEDTVVKEAVTSLESCAVADMGNKDEHDEPFSLKEQISKYMIENMRLRAQLEESDCKLITLQDDLHKISKEGVHGEFKVDTLQRECQTLRIAVQRYKEEEETLKTALRVSNTVQADLRKRLRTAITDKEKYEKDFKRLVVEKGSIEKVMVTSTEMPAVSQVDAGLGSKYLAKAESLESARKEIVILESQVKELRRERTENNGQFVEQVLTEITTELNRARNLLQRILGDGDEGVSGKLNDTRESKETSQDVDDLHKGIRDLRNIVNTLEIVGQHFPNILKEKNLIAEELRDVRNEKTVLSDKLVYLQEKLNNILEERRVLENIGADARKELAALVECLSTEREEKISISSEHSEMQHKLQEADRNEKILLSKIKDLEKECEKLYERNRCLEMKIVNKSGKEKVKELIVASDEALVESTLNAKELEIANRRLESQSKEKHMTLESLCKDFKEISVLCGKLETRNKVLVEEKSLMVEEMYAYSRKLDTKNQALLVEIKTKDQKLQSMHEENRKLLVLRKSLDTQVRHLDREAMLLKDRVVCSETEKERIEDANRQHQNEIQELYLLQTKDKMIREKLENLFYENTKLKEQKRMLVARLQSVERDVKSQLLTIRDLQTEKEELHVKLKNTHRERQQEELQKNRLLELLDKQEQSTRKEIDALTQNPQLDKMKRLEAECMNKESIIDKMKEENATLIKENNLLRRACEKLKENRSAYKRMEPSSYQQSSPRLSPRTQHLSGSKQSSLSSFDRHSTSQTSFSDQPFKAKDSTVDDYIKQQTPVSSPRALKSHVTGELDATSICSQECYCSPILSVVNLCPFEIQQPTDLRPSHCPKCNKKKKTALVISEHYV